MQTMRSALSCACDCIFSHYLCRTFQFLFLHCRTYWSSVCRTRHGCQYITCSGTSFGGQTAFVWCGEAGQRINILKDDDRCSLNARTIDAHLHIRVNMPVLSKFDVRPAVRAWFANADRRSRQSVAKATMQPWFTDVFWIWGAYFQDLTQTALFA